MPAYGTPQAGGVVTALQPGDGQLYLFNAESPAAGTASISFNRQSSPSMDDAGVTFQIMFAAAAPTAVVAIQGANVDVDAGYQNLYSSTFPNANTTQLDNYTDTTRWAFYRAKLISQSAGGALTVVAQR